MLMRHSPIQVTRSWLSLSATGLLQGTPANDDVGTHIVVRVTDRAGVSTEKALI